MIYRPGVYFDGLGNSGDNFLNTVIDDASSNDLDILPLAAAPFTGTSGGRRSGLTGTASVGTIGGSSGGIIPVISARLNASCTLLMNSLRVRRD
jgi:hypothetical protein